MLQHFAGIDHVVVSVRDLDAAADTWRRLGFTLSPRGTHSAHMGTGNYTIMLSPDYFELLSVLVPTPHNKKTSDFLAVREGIDRIALNTTDAEAGAAELAAHGLAVAAPVAFGRPVELPGGGSAEARFRTIQWPATEKPAGIALFACQHLTPEAVWIPELMTHPNTAQALDRVEVLARDPAGAAAQTGRLLDRKPVPESGGALRVPSGSGRADIVFLTRDTFTARHPGVTLDLLPEEGSACLSIRVRDYAMAQQHVAASGLPAVIRPDRLAVLPTAGTGIVVELLPR